MRRWHQKRHRERVDAGLCIACGAPLAAGDSAARLLNCAACRSAVLQRRLGRLPEAERQEWLERRARKLAERLAARRTAPAIPTCTRCGGRDLKLGGRKDGKQRYRCQGCGCRSFGRPAAARGGDYPCPNSGCGGNCQKRGRDYRGRQLYWCPQCRRGNTRLYPSRVMPEGGPFPFRRAFSLSLMAARALDEYVQKHTMSPARALRAIFRRWADEPVVCVAAYPRAEEYGEPVRLAREDVNTRLPDLRRQACLKRMAGGNRQHTTVLVTWKLTVALDAKAYQGLLRFMRRTGMGHQDAARALILAAGPVARGQHGLWRKGPEEPQERTRGSGWASVWDSED